MNGRRYLRMFHVLRACPPRDRKKVFALLRLYSRLDRDIERFKKTTSLRCQTGCGRCCENPHVETTALEMLPLAVDLWQNGQAEDRLARLAGEQGAGRCIFYQPDARVPGKGRCSVYPWRPLICRLYGFSGRPDKYGRPVYVTCSTIKELYPEEYERVREAAQTDPGTRLPMMRPYTLEVFHLDPSLGQEQLPINTAMRQALERIGLYRSLAGLRPGG